MGDCNGRGAFTHTSYNDFEIIAANLFEGEERRVEDRILTYGLFIDPPLGRAGMTETEVRRKGIKALVAKMPMEDVGRAYERSETKGFMKIIVDAESKQILGAALLGIEGDEIVQGLLDMMYAKAPYTVIQRAMHIHPTVYEMIPYMFDDWSRWSRPESRLRSAAHDHDDHSSNATAGGRTPPELRRARLATATLFFANGCGLGSWLPHIPDVKIWHGLSDGVLGLALLAIAGGAVAALPVAGALTARFGSRPIVARRGAAVLRRAALAAARAGLPAAARGLRPARHRHRRARCLDERPRRAGRGALWPADHVVVPRPVQPWRSGRRGARGRRDGAWRGAGRASGHRGRDARRPRCWPAGRRSCRPRPRRPAGRCSSLPRGRLAVLGGVALRRFPGRGRDGRLIGDLHPHESRRFGQHRGIGLCRLFAGHGNRTIYR